MGTVERNSHTRPFLSTSETLLLCSLYRHSELQMNLMNKCTYTGCVWEPSLVITPSLSISICLNVLTFCRISSSVYLNDGREDTTVS